MDNEIQNKTFDISPATSLVEGFGPAQCNRRAVLWTVLKIREWQQTHPENVKKSQKKYRETHSDSIKANRKKYNSKPEVKARQKAYAESPEQKARQKEHRQIDQVKEKSYEYQREYNRTHPEKVSEHRKTYCSKHPDRVKASQKKYNSKPEVKEKKHKYHQSKKYKDHEKIRAQDPKRIESERSRQKAPKYRAWTRNYCKSKRATDEHFRISQLLRSLLRFAMNNYSNTGKIMTSKEYGIDYEACAKHLGAPPDNIHKWHIDHIRPCCSFNLSVPKQVKECFSPKNLRWLTKEENLAKIVEDKKLSLKRRYS